jgi:hypothetical protein
MREILLLAFCCWIPADCTYFLTVQGNTWSGIICCQGHKGRVYQWRLEARGVEFVVVAVAGCHEYIRLFVILWSLFCVGLVYRINVNDEKKLSDKIRALYCRYLINNHVLLQPKYYHNRWIFKSDLSFGFVKLWFWGCFERIKNAVGAFLHSLVEFNCD